MTPITDWNIPSFIEGKFNRETWLAAEACIATHTTLLLSNAECMGLLLVGPSSSNKTTILRFFEGEIAEGQIYKSDDVTPAAFVSHDSSKTEEELRNQDLLPKIKHGTLLSKDMGKWFSGQREDIDDKMATVATLMDGEGYTRNTGSHGERGYHGDYRFNFIGATTPLPPRAWDMMGNTGNRFLFHEKTGSVSVEEAVNDVFDGSGSYKSKVNRCQNLVSGYLDQIWNDLGGSGSIEWDGSPEQDIQDTFAYFTKVVRHGRAPIKSTNGDDKGEPIIEGPHRIASSLKYLAQGRAILQDRRFIQASDIELCARVALSTMHRKRRPVVAFLLDPDSPMEVKAKHIEDNENFSRKTAILRMEMMDTLGFGYCQKNGNGVPTQFQLSDEFKWPDTVKFPEMFRKE